MDGKPAMINEILLQERSDGILGITMNNPDKLNALSESMIDALQEAFDEAAETPGVKCIILRGAGRAFCAGHDLKELTAARNRPDRGHEYFKMIFDKCAAMMMSIIRLPQPVIAEVHGAAVAAGCQLVATCDMAVASERARFGVNGVDIGLFCSTPMVALSRNVSRKHAFEMLTTGRLVDASEALGLGLVNKVVAGDDLAEETRELAALVASKLGAAVKIGKRAFYEQAQMPLEDAYRYAGEVMVENMLYRDTEEGITAFLEKRSPAWRSQPQGDGSGDAP